MVEVTIQFDGMTRVWLSKRARKELTARAKRARTKITSLLAYMRRYAEEGFEQFENNGVLNAEWGGVWRIRSGLFRVIGFYEDGAKQNFIVTDAYLKRGQKLTKPQRARIDTAVDCQKRGDWRFAEDDQ